MQKAYRISALLTLLLLQMGGLCFARTGPFTRSLRGSLKTGDSILVSSPAAGAGSFKDFITFRLADQQLVHIAFSCSLTLKLASWKTAGQRLPDTGTVMLRINYSAKAGAAFKLKDAYTFTGAYKLKVTIAGVNCPELGNALPAAFELSAGITTDGKPPFSYKATPGLHARVLAHRTAAAAPKKKLFLGLFSLSGSSIHNSSGLIDTGKQLQLFWAPDLTANEYDVEWTTTDDGSKYQDTIKKMADTPSYVARTSLLNNIFLHNATRVTTTDTSYLLSLCYNDDYILVRIRSVQYTSAGIRLLGPWGYTLANGHCTLWKLNWYENSLDWQYSAAFAEEGKKKEVVSYFDGTLRGRQTVTINNSDNVAVVQENVYDEFGRATASILPAPQHNPVDSLPSLHYFHNQNQDSLGQVYNSNNVAGRVRDTCEFNPDTLNSVSGAAMYYSPRNLFLRDTAFTNHQRFDFYIPNAEGYPLSVTQYTGDNTGRIKYQGGVGKVFQPGKDSTNNKITKYYYGKPEQWELDRLFGNDVGYASHYLKNMVVDPNGQVSISYVNASGKTIATALSGAPPASMDPLKTTAPDTTVTVSLLDSGKFVYDNTGKVFSATTTYLSPLAGQTAKLKYSIRKLIDKFPIDSICSNCYYKLSIKVANDCGDIVYATSSPVQIGSATADCDAKGIAKDSTSVPFSNIGEYYITFSFAFDKTVMDRYADSVVSKGQAKGVIKRELDFILPYLDSLNFKSCLSDCSTCLQTLGSQANFLTMVRTKLVALDVDTVGSTAAINTWATNEYTVLKAYCDSLHAHCDSSTYRSPCQKYMDPMLQDVSPGGQYALFDTQNNALDTAENVIYNNWRTVFPVKADTTAAYRSSLITLPDGSVTSPYDAGFTYQKVVQYWQEGWAQKFLPYHPEYCKLLFCEYNEHYEQWDQTVQDSITLASQIPGIPYAPPGLHYDHGNGAWLVAADPFFQTGAPGASMATDFENDLQNYTHNIANATAVSNKGLVQFVDFLLYCAAPGTTTNTLSNTLNNWDNCSPDPTCRVPDREWMMYKDFYFELKQQYYTRLRLKTTCANKCTVGTPQSLPTNSACPSVSDFSLADYSSADGMPTDTCDSTKKLVTLTYVPGDVATKVTVILTYASGTNTTGLPTTVTLEKGDNNYMFCVPATLPAASITIAAAVCDSCQVNPLVFGTWINDHIVQTTYGGSPVTKTLHIDTQVYFPGTLSIKPDNTYDVMTTFHPYSGSWELNDSCQFALYSQGVRYILKKVSTDSLSLTYRQGNFEETWYYASTGLQVTCTTPDTIHVTALQGTNTYFKNAYPHRHLITVIAGSPGTPPPFTCVNSSGSDTTSTSAYHTCLSIYTPYSTVKYQNVWVFDCVYDNVPSTCPPELLTKESRFPDSFTNPVVGDSTTVIAQNLTAVKRQVTSSCEANAGNWIAALDTGLVHGGCDSVKIAHLRDTLTMICEMGADQYHPFGASSLPVGAGGPGGYNTFGDAIKGVLHISSFTLDLNPWLISAPYPYTPQMQGNYQTVTNTNQPICDLIAKYQHQCDSVNAVHGTHLTLYQYLSQTFGDSMILTSAGLDSLKKSCNSCNFVLDQDVTLPVFLVPGTAGCITPLEYAAADSAFVHAFSSIDTTNANYQNVYANFRNQRWGFMLGYNDYKVYEDSLITDPNKMLCNTIITAAPPTDSLACIESQIAVGVANGKTAYNAYIDSVRKAFEQSYVYTCTNAGEAVSLTTKQKIYHYTLYYYDQADNLIRTIPPEGVALLTAQQINLVDRSRKNNPLDCTYTGPSTNANKTTAFNALSMTLSRASAAIEFWVYEDGTTQNHFVEITPDKKYLFQLNIAGSTLAIDIYPADTTTKGITFKPASIHYRADITTQLPLDPFTHLVLQGDSLGKANTAQLYLNGVHFTATQTNTTVGPGFTVGSNSSGIIAPDSIQTLKHLRLYSQPLDTAVIWANANNTCFMPTDSSHMTGWSRFNVPSPGGPTTINDSSTVETRLPAVYPTHRIATNYYYNSTNQVSTQNSPDGGTNRFWYDLLSRLIFSQNDKQLPAKNYSYTKYDTLGRIIEVGQKNTTDTLGKPDYLQTATINNFYTMGLDSQVTHTYYDTVVRAGNGIQNVGQSNIAMRKRVSLTTYQTAKTDTVTQATYYSYDLDGNVNNLYQQIAGLGIKRLYYEYDLISGKVNFIGYQNGKNDQFYYQYVYDADNRITQAWASVKADTTSYGFGSKLDPTTQKLDASYQYYLHGPLARMELGDVGTKVQGVDYAYTLQGWVKGVNSQFLRASMDMGQDSLTIAKDAYAYSLGYYTNDYKPIGGSTSYPAFKYQYAQSMGDITGQSLYNGNIGTSTITIDTINSNNPVGYSYHYDQLNRLIHLRQHSSITSWSHLNINPVKGYQEDFSYDGNGNILTLRRTAVDSTHIDTFKYQYNRDVNSNLTNNKLNWLKGKGTATYTGTLQSFNNYTYDSIGNMIADRQDSIKNITWSVYGKIQSITDTAHKVISYAYNTAQERVSKTANSLITYYVRDAQGNTIALYDNAGSNIYWREQHLYGSSRLGMWLPNINLTTGGGLAKWDTIGHKSYELTNHLQNVVATVSDARTSVSGYYKPMMETAQDYYGFGALMPGRNVNTANTRYGFNGKENDNDVKGLGNQQNYGKRIYDTRVGKFLSVDPLTGSFANLTPYQYASDRPIDGIDLDGKEHFNFNLTRLKDGSTQLTYVNKTDIKHWFGDASGIYDFTVKFNGKSYEFEGNQPDPFANSFQDFNFFIQHPEDAISERVVKTFDQHKIDWYVFNLQVETMEQVSANQTFASSRNAVKAPAEVGEASTNNYRETFFEANPELKGKVVVHHAIEQQVSIRYSKLFTSAEINSLENLRGIPNEINNSIHLSIIRKLWNNFYETNPNPTRESFLNFATQLDNNLGHLFTPPSNSTYLPTVGGFNFSRGFIILLGTREGSPEKKKTN